MKEKQLMNVGGVEFTSTTDNNKDPYIIGVFADEHCGKTRLALTGPSGVGCVPTEMKSYVTLDKDSRELGKVIFKPSDPLSLIISGRKVNSLADDIARQKFYMKHVETFENTVFGLLAHKDVNIVMIDKFTHYVKWKEFAINGMSDKFIKVQGKLYKDKGEVVQGVIDFIHDLSAFGKPVVLLCASQPDYDVVDKEKNPLRNTWDTRPFKHLGSHCNVVVELKDNKFWDPNSDEDKKSWHYRLNVRRCQKNAALEGPEGNHLLQDEEISLTNLIARVDENVDIEKWM